MITEQDLGNNPYECSHCGRRGNYMVGICARRYHPNAQPRFVMETTDLDLEGFCGFNCLLAHYGK